MWGSLKNSPMKVKIKKVTLGSLVGPFEASIAEYKSWAEYCKSVEFIVDELGKDRHPDDIYRAEIEALKLKEHVYGHGKGFYYWMQHMGFAYTNPFIPPPPKKKGYSHVEVEVAQ